MLLNWQVLEYSLLWLFLPFSTISGGVLVNDKVWLTEQVAIESSSASLLVSVEYL
jgi:hypothetical protein